MPELPEVECLTRAVRRVLEGGVLRDAVFYRADLREPIPIKDFRRVLVGETIQEVYRRSKYLLMRTRKGHGVFHLGMTGNILCQASASIVVPHTHAIFTIAPPQSRKSDNVYLHFVDPRRFGRIGCIEGEALDQHSWFDRLGPEPLTSRNLGAHLYRMSRGKKAPVKCFLMDAHTVVGVGNIYASESLYRAGIDPCREARQVSPEEYAEIAKAVKITLRRAIKAGGTSFRDFKNSDGNPGYFAMELAVYDREGEPCRHCGNTIHQIRQAGRSTYYCAFCQK